VVAHALVRNDGASISPPAVGIVFVPATADPNFLTGASVSCVDASTAIRGRGFRGSNHAFSLMRAGEEGAFSLMRAGEEGAFSLMRAGEEGVIFCEISDQVES